MSITLPLDKMTVLEKIQTMESLWDDLCHHNSKDISSLPGIRKFSLKEKKV